MKFANIYGQAVQHDDVALVASREMLEQLQKAINSLLTTTQNVEYIRTFDSAGEEFKLYIELLEDEKFEKLESPSEKIERKLCMNMKTK